MYRSGSNVFRAAAALLVLAAGTLASGCSSPSRPIVPTVPLSRVTVVPASDTLVVGGARQFVAVAYDTSGHPVNGETFTWTTSDAAVATVTNSGLVTAHAEGDARLIARAGGRTDTASVFVIGATGGWTIQTSNTLHDLYGVFFQPDGRTGFAVGDAGTLLASTDAGVTWTIGTSGTSANLTSVWFTSASVGWTVGASGALMKSTDGGATWTRQTNLATVNDLTCVRFSDPLHGWITGAGGLVARTRDGGASWTTQFPVVFKLWGVSFADSLDGWVAGGNGTVLGTHDGGASWYPVSLGVSAQTFKAVARPNDVVAIAVGTQGTVARTSASADSITWATGSVGANDNLEAVSMTGPATGWAVGTNGSGFIMATTDAGASWTSQAAGVTETLHGVMFVDALRGWAVGASGRILHTTHAGS